MLLADMRGIALASGSACLSKVLGASHVLKAIGLEASLAQAAVIFSLGKDNNDEEIDYVLETLPQIIAKLREMSPAWEEPSGAAAHL